MNNLPELNLAPFFNRIFVIRDETESTTAGGVFLPETDKEKPNKGIVIAAGPECKMAFAGQHIIFGQHHGVEIMVGGVEYTILREEDVYAGDKKQQRQFTEEEKNQIFRSVHDRN